MTRLYASPVARRIALAGILIAIALVVVVSPAEQTLGQAVKVVYVHVALTRAGEIGFMLAGLIGLAVLVTGGEPLAGWMRLIAWAALALYVAGFAVSLAAQALAWGGVVWREPRVMAALNVLAGAVIVVVLDAWLSLPRLRGLLQAALGGYVVWELVRTPNVLHPGSAISASSSLAIQATGVALAALSVLLGAWIVWALALRGGVEDPALGQPEERHDGE